MTDYPNWFNLTAKANFEKFLPKKDGLVALQLGVYTGDASLWMLDNIPNLKLTDVDTWQGSDEEVHKTMDFDDVYKTYLAKTDNRPVTSYRSTTTFFLKRAECVSGKYGPYDFIYIDADHTTVGVLMDAELSWPLLKSGGIMAFDDYTWAPELSPELTPTLGIDLFLARHEGEYETLVVNAQVWIQKK